MQTREQEISTKIDRYFTQNWTLTELAAILEPMSMRTLTSWISGQTLKIRPVIWTAQQIEAIGGAAAEVRQRKRAKYGFPNLLQCVMARTLFDAGVGREMVQTFVERFPAADFCDGRSFGEKFDGYFLILTRGTPQVGYFFPDRESLFRAIAVGPSQCAVFNFASMVSEVIARLDAWEERRPYVPKRDDEVIVDAYRVWAAGGAIQQTERERLTDLRADVIREQLGQKQQRTREPE